MVPHPTHPSGNKKMRYMNKAERDVIWATIKDLKHRQQKTDKLIIKIICFTLALVYILMMGSAIIFI